MKILLLALVCLLDGGCAFQRSYEIALPPGQETVVGPSQPVVVPQAGGQTAAVPPRIEMYRPDPSKGLVMNWSRNVFIKFWMNSRPPAPPTLELGPEQSAPVNAPLETVLIYVEGRIKAGPYGWQSVGSFGRELTLRNWSYGYGGYSWRFYVSDGDFPR